MKKEKTIMENSDIEDVVIELQQRKSYFIFDKKTADLCFLIIENHPNLNEKRRAALALTSIINKDAAKKVQEFLKNNKKIDKRVREILEANIMRMAGF